MSEKQKEIRVVRANHWGDIHTRWFEDGKENPNPYSHEKWDALKLTDYLDWLKQMREENKKKHPNEDYYSYKVYEVKLVEELK